MRRSLIAFLLLIPFAVASYVSPGKPTGFVNDFANMLSPSAKLDLEARLSDFSKTTSNEIAIVTIKNLGDESIETYAEKLFQEWGIGNKELDNGLLLLISKEDRAIRIEVGYGLEPIITDIESSRIIREVLTHAFKESKYDEGVTLALDRIMNDISTGEIPPEPKKMPDVSALFYPAIFLIIMLASVLGVSKSWWMGGVIGGIIALAITFFLGFLLTGLISFVVLIPLGLLFDFLVSRSYEKHKAGGPPPWFLGGGGRGIGGGFGGFGGGMSGGGGASGRW